MPHENTPNHSGLCFRTRLSRTRTSRRHRRVAVRHDSVAGQAARANVLTPDEYVTRAGVSLERDGFFEREIGRSVDTFGRITQVFSAYDSKRTLADAKPFARGINSIQLLNDGTRWWVVSIYRESERPDNPIPARYLGAGR